MMMGNEPIVALLDQNHCEAGRLRRELAVFVAHEVVEASHEDGLVVEHLEFLLPELDLVSGAHNDRKVFRDRLTTYR